LPVAFSRRYQFDRWAAPGENGHRPAWMKGPLSDWDVDLPHLHGRFPLAPQQSTNRGWQTGVPGQRCSVATKALAAPTVNSGYIPEDYWYGNYLYMPGKGDQELVFIENTSQIKAQGGYVYRWGTKDGWYFSCLPTTANGIEGEAFLAHSPDGMKYWFNQFAGTIRSTDTADMRDGLRSGEVRILLTRAEDRFGNYVVYEYASDSDAKLLSITASDGRRLTMTYSGPHVKTVSDGIRTWTYTYGDWQLGAVADGTGFLWHVQQPDGSKWTYQTTYAPGLIELDSSTCGTGPSWIFAGDMIFQATHPSGAKGKFVFNNRRHSRTYVPKACRIYTSPPYSVKEYIPLSFSTISLTRKEITGPGIGPRIWQWSYETVAARYDSQCGGNSCPTSRSVSIIRPDGSLLRQHFGIMYGYNDGLLLSSEILANDGLTVVSQRNYSYQFSPIGQSYESGYGSRFRTYADPRVAYVQPRIVNTIIQNGATFEWRVAQCGQSPCLDAFARPTSFASSNSLGYSRTDRLEYHDDTVAWSLGHVKRRINLDTGMVESEIIYNGQSLPWRNYVFGKLRNAYTYYADGTIASIVDGASNTMTLSDWKRGIPQFIRHPATPESPTGATESATVSGEGWITSTTNEVGARTCYGYDTMGRLASITYPSETQLGVCDTSRWNQTTIATEFITTPEHGIAAGHWRTSTGTGGGYVNVYYDAMLRPVLEESLDLNNIAGTLSQVVKRYDSSGRLSFQSYPTNNVDNAWDITQGVRTFYDALDRTVRVEQDSELGTLATTTEYLSGLQVRTTNPRGLQTTTSFMAWDQPGYDLPILSQQPEGKTIQIGRHPQFGWPLALTQRNAANTLSQTRRYVYDGNAQMCKTIEPETGATVTGYDAAGNPAWSASGLTGGDYTNALNCSDAAAAASGRVVNRVYDPRNRVSQLQFPDGRGNQVLTYTPDGLTASITTYNDPNNATAVVNAYNYNYRRILTGESVSQPGWYTWGIGYGYNANAHLSLHTYPTGLTVDYAPNNLGQPTKAGTYASGAQYYPNGGLKQFTYGNGIVHSMTQNARQLPQRVTSSGGVLDYRYYYDQNGNPEHIANELVNGYDPRDRWMIYDGLDRLTDAGSASFGGDHWHRFTYDALDNMKSWKLAGVKDYADYGYDPQNRLTNIRNTAGATVVGLDYDPQGNLSNKNGQGYDFDYANRLRMVAGKEAYRYDGLGRRVQTTMTDGSQTTLWQYSQAGQMLFSSKWNGSTYLNHTTQENVYLGGSLIATIDHDWPSNAITAVKYQHTDALGSPVAVTNTLGQVIERNDYEPYGAIIGKPTHSGIGYTGHVMDGATGLTYMQQRYYDQSIGRFLSVDPVTANSGSGVNFNRYWYADANPYGRIDPDGRQSCGSNNVGSDVCDLPVTATSAIAGFVKAIVRPVAQQKALVDVPVGLSTRDKSAVRVVNNAINKASVRVQNSGDTVAIRSWNSTTWRWDPDNNVFANDPDVAAFVRPSDPTTITIGRRFAEFSDASMTFTYHGATFKGGAAGMLFGVLHEFGHVHSSGVGVPGSNQREELANKIAYNLMQPRDRADINCQAVCR
jgi:RHS repeat-associated protein